MDPIIGAAVVKAAADSATTERAAQVRLLERALGPTADVIGQWLAEKAASRFGNFAKIAAAAERKTREGVEGAVSPRVAMRVFDEGAYSDEEIMVEYLSGVLATARTPGGKDDRGVSWAALIARLSSQQLRLHYVLYSGLRLPGCRVDATIRELCARTHFVAFSELVDALNQSPDEFHVEFFDAFYGLHREGLVGEGFGYGEPDAIKPALRHLQVTVGGLAFIPSRPGILLWLWAHGAGNSSIHSFIDEDIDVQLTADWGDDAPRAASLTPDTEGPRQTD